VQRFQEQVRRDLRECGVQIDRADPKVMALRPPLQSLGPRARAWPVFLAYCFVLPAQFAAFCAFGMVAMAIVRSFTSRGEAGGMLDTILLWLGSCFLAVLMVVVTLASAAVLGMGVTTGSLCLDPGAALLGILQNAAHPAPSPGTLEAAKYYLMPGEGHAPAAMELDACRRRIDSVRAEIVSNQRHLDIWLLFAIPCTG